MDREDREGGGAYYSRRFPGEVQVPGTGRTVTFVRGRSLKSRLYNIDRESFNNEARAMELGRFRSEKLC